MRDESTARDVLLVTPMRPEEARRPHAVDISMSTPIPSSHDGAPQTGEIDGIWDALERLAERIDAGAPDDGAEKPGPSST